MRPDLSMTRNAPDARHVPWQGLASHVFGGALLFAVTGMGFAFLAYLGVALTREEGRIAALWAPNAVLIAIIIRNDTRNWPIMLPAAFVGNVTSNSLGGDDMVRAVSLSLSNSIEMMALLLLLTLLKCRRPDFSTNRDIGRFVLAAILSACISGLVATLALQPGNWDAAWGLWLKWARADGLGLLLFVPAITILLDSWENRQAFNPKKIGEALLIVACGTGVSILTFWQTSYPFLFLDAPIVLVYALRLGVVGNAVAIVNLAIVASVSTSLGYGPINLVQGGTTEKIMVLQVFLASSFAVGLPFSALVQSLRQSEAGHRRAAEELANANRTFDTLAKISPVGIFRSDLNGECTYANRKSLEFVGVTFREAIGGDFARNICESDREKVLRRWKQEVARGKGFSDEVRITVPGQPERWLQTLITPERCENGLVTGFMGVQVDVTERRAAEREAREARDCAEEASRAKTNFLANMSHEIRTPMNGVLGFADILLTSDLDAKQRHQVELIAESGRSLVTLIDDILDLSKVDADAMRISTDLIDLRQTLNAPVQLMRGAAIKKGLGLALEIADDLPKFVSGDALRIRQIITNLLGNAVKFSSDGSINVVAEYCEDGGLPFIQVAISDEGIGISPDRLETIFEQFAQANDAVAPVYGGSGLGLAISRRLARLMGGDIAVASVVGEGSTFVVRLPLHAAHEAVGTAAKSPARRSLKEAPTQRGNILIVEDHPINQELISSLVSSFGYTFDIAADGVEAVEMVTGAGADDEYRLILMDIQMPRMDGLKATRAIRDAGFTPEKLPILALTANAFADDLDACKAAGMQDHLSKPINSAKLKSVIGKWIPSEPPRQDDEENAFFKNVVLRHRRKFDELTSQIICLAHDRLDPCRLTSRTSEERLADKLHQLCGIAELFARDDLGRSARVIERMLTKDRSTVANDDLEKALRDFIRIAS